MRYAGLDPDHGVLALGNYDQTLLLPSTGVRARRPRPIVSDAAVHRLDLAPRSDDSKRRARVFPGPRSSRASRCDPRHAAIPVEESKQSTNSWGLRGPEPDLDAPCAASCWATRSCRAFSWTMSTRRRNACGAISNAAQDQGLCPEHGRSWLFAGAILLLARCLRRSLPAPVRRRERLRQRFRRRRAR